jgi:hypothetical protein
MPQETSKHRVALTFIGPPPARQVTLASGVAEVEVDGHELRCVICGSFQPLLEALQGYEVISFTSIPTKGGG